MRHVPTHLCGGSRSSRFVRIKENKHGDGHCARHSKPLINDDCNLINNNALWFPCAECGSLSQGDGEVGSDAWRMEKPYGVRNKKQNCVWSLKSNVKDVSIRTLKKRTATLWNESTISIQNFLSKGECGYIHHPGDSEPQWPSFIRFCSKLPFSDLENVIWSSFPIQSPLSCLNSGPYRKPDAPLSWIASVHQAFPLLSGK